MSYGGLKKIPDIPENEKKIEKTGPFCLSQNSNFLLLRVNRRADALYRVKIDNSAQPVEAYLEFLHSISYLDAIINERVNFSCFLSTELRTEFLVVDCPVCRMLAWDELRKSLRVTGRNEFEQDKDLRLFQDRDYSAICRVGDSNVFVVCDSLGGIGKIVVEEIPEGAEQESLLDRLGQG